MVELLTYQVGWLGVVAFVVVHKNVLPSFSLPPFPVTHHHANHPLAANTHTHGKGGGYQLPIHTGTRTHTLAQTVPKVLCITQTQFRASDEVVLDEGWWGRGGV